MSKHISKRRTISLDVETAGLVHQNNGIIEIHYIIDDEEGNVICERTLRMNPLAYRPKVSAKALEVNGFTRDELTTFPHPKEALSIFLGDARRNCNDEVYNIVAYNADFDKDFLIAWVDALEPGSYYKLFTYKPLDPYKVILYWQELGLIDTGASQSLQSVCKYYGIELKAHDAKSDANAVRQLHYMTLNKLGGSNG